jgi:anthranilate phosphoribosyltransferase
MLTLIEKLIEGMDLTTQESEAAIHEILKGANPHQTAAFLALLRAKGETAEELLGMAQAMQGFMIPVSLGYPVLDIVGTGGDKANTINISTGASILAASCGVKIAKHGSRSASSLCGSADVLEALGVRFSSTPEEVSQQIAEMGFAFLFAPHFHPAMKEIKQIRSGLGLRTAFNVLGPILNPAGAEYQLIGVSHPELLELVAAVLQRLGTKRSLVFHGCGLDELSCMGPAQVLDVTAEGIRKFTLDPEALGLKKCSLEDLQGGDAKENAQKLQRLLKGEEEGAADTLILNAAVAIHLYGLAPSIEEGIVIARENLKNGNAYRLLERLQHA